MDADLNSDSKPVFTWHVRVYYEDTDAGSIVYYANYLKFFERARTEWLRAAGIGQHELAQQDGVVFIVKSTAVEYHAPARLDDELLLTVHIASLGRASVEFTQEAWRTGDAPQLLATGKIRVGCIDARRFRPVAIPGRVLQKIQPGKSVSAVRAT